VCPVEADFKQVPALRETRAQKLLSLETMLDVVAQLPDLEGIEYFGFGEPFLYKDTITFLREVRRTRPGIEIVTATNGTVLTPVQIQAIATEALLDRVVFSIDGATHDSYRKYRIGGSFDKAFGKMKALADACRAAGTWRKYVTEPPGRVQVTWQYILFEWNDSDEELSLAREFARNIDVPIEWVITSGYGASKRILPRSPEAVRLMDAPDSFIGLSSNADIDLRLTEKGIGNIHAYCEVHTQCELLSLPFGHGNDKVVYQARIQADDTSIHAPAGSKILFNINVENKTTQTWDVLGSDYLRLGFLLKTDGGQTIRELLGVKLPPATAQPGGHDILTILLDLPEQPGDYKLVLDVVQEYVCWFSERGSPPLTFTLRLD
jgi:hypothetical protein